MSGGEVPKLVASRFELLKVDSMSIPVDIQSDELSKCLFSESNDAYFVIDPAELSISALNPAAVRISGYKHAELEGVAIDDLLVGENDNAIRDLIDGCRKTAFIHSRDGYQLKCKDCVRDVNVSLSRLHGEMRTWSLIVLRDVTKRRELERSLKQSNDRYRDALAELKDSRETIILQEQMRAVSLLASGVAHDLNNLLSPIVTLSTLLMTNSGLDESVRQQLAVIQRSALGAADSVRRLSRYRQVESSGQQAVSLRELIDDLSHVASLRLRSLHEQNGKSISFCISADDSLPDVRGTEAGIRQVLLNLVFNAIDAAGDGGNVVVQATSLNEGVSVEVADDGVGMDPETLAHCFDAFFTTKPEGAGIGLSISKGTIESYSGSIEAESSVGAGSRFRFWLPALAGAEEKRDFAINSDCSVVDGLSVLCVEDDGCVRASLVSLLEAMGASVEQAADGATGISMSRSRSYDAVITDLWMDGVSGWDVIQAMRRDSDPTPVCILSGWEESEVIRQAPLGIRPDRVLSKPVVASQLYDFLVEAAKVSKGRT